MDWRLLPACVLCTVLASAGRASSGDEPDDDQPVPTFGCQVHVSIEESGTAFLQVTVYWQKPKKVLLEQIERAVTEIAGAPLREVHKSRTRAGMNYGGKADDLFATSYWKTEGSIDLAPLAAVLRPEKIDVIDVWISEPWRTLGRFDGGRPMTQQFKVWTAAPQPIFFTFDNTPGDALRPAVILGSLLLVPIVILLWRRWLALRDDAAEPTLVWYRFWRWTHWVTMGTWVVWLTAVSALSADRLLAFVLPVYADDAMALRWVLMLVPPWLVMVVAGTVAQEVFARLKRADQSTREIMRRALWSIASGMVPLLLAVFGIMAVMQGAFRGGAVWLVSALVVRAVCGRLAARGQDLTPHAVTFGLFRDRVFALARDAGVALKQLYVVPTGKMPEANAFAMHGGNVLITDYLLKHLSRRESDAILAHELAHLKYNHPRWLMVIFFAALFLPMIIVPQVIDWSRELGVWRHIPFGLILALVVIYFVSRRFEYQVDSYAAWLTGDPEALITGLVKVHRLSLMPMRWGKYEEHLVTHPSTSHRLEAIARRNGVSRRRLGEILAQPEATEESYPLPAEIAGEDAVFTTGFKAKSGSRSQWALFAGIVLMPALAAAVISWLDLRGEAKWLALGGGVALTAVVYFVLQNFMPLLAYPELRRRLKAKIQGQGFDIAGWGGSFVAFAPDGEPRLYENSTNWDFGFLFLAGDRLCYVGEKTRFALQRDQITSIALRPGMRRWWRVPYLYVRWRDVARGAGGTFNVRAGEVGSMLQLRRAMRELRKRLRDWHEGPASAAEAPAPLAGLSAPSLGEVTSSPADELVKGSALIGGMVFACGLGAVAAFLLAVPFDPDEGGLGWWVLAIIAGVSILDVLPFWLQARPARARQSEDTPILAEVVQEQPRSPLAPREDSSEEADALSSRGARGHKT